MTDNDRCIEVNDIKLHYIDWGSHGLQPMLLLHGFTGHAHVWDDFASRFRKDYHVIALDQRGHGESEWSKGGAYSLDDYFTDIVTFLDKITKRSIILVGHSMGGRHALFYASALPQNVFKLILVDSRPGKSQRAANKLKHHLATLPLEADSFEEAARAIWDLYPYLTWPVCQSLASYGYQQSQAGKVVPKYDVGMSEDAARCGYVTEDLRPFLKSVKCPTLIIRGEDSEFLSREEAEEMYRLIPDAVFKEIPGSTHMPAHENPEAFYNVVNEFLGK